MNDGTLRFALDPDRFSHKYNSHIVDELLFIVSSHSTFSNFFISIMLRHSFIYSKIMLVLLFLGCVDQASLEV